MDKLNTEQYKSIGFDEIVVTAKIGANLDNSIKEAVMLSLTENKDVIVKFQDKEFKITNFNVLNSVEGYFDYCKDM